ncbi:MAG TPA: hypothetical protein VN755_08025, partial [Steroidobacteraceae bacterium]|nr:hypothetical protein [Steroidobacteraceae bacterium]
ASTPIGAVAPLSTGQRCRTYPDATPQRLHTAALLTGRRRPYIATNINYFHNLLARPPGTQLAVRSGFW